MNSAGNLEMQDTNANSITYILLRCTIPEGLEEELGEWLAPWPVLGTEVAEGTGGGVQVTVYLSASDCDSAREVRRALAVGGATAIQEGRLREEDWLAKYRQRVRPFSVGKGWWVDPHPARPTAAPAGRMRLVIEPRMAFGTGSHESTQGILSTLEDLDVSNRRVLDVGTGSGILALAAERLGAEWVVGLDIDGVAIQVAADTARQQDWESRVSFVLGSTECIAGEGFDIVLCNMITGNLLPLVSDLNRALGSNGVLVCSGILATEIPMVTDSLAAMDLKVAKRRLHGDWASLTVTRTESK